MQARKLALALAVALWSIPAIAEEPNQAGEENLDLTKIMASIAGGAVMPEASEKEGLPKFEDVTKDMESTKGLFTLWYYPEGTKDKDPEKLLCQIPSGFLGQKFMLSTSFSGGGFFTGFPLDERVVQWELRDKQLLLIEPEARFVVEKSKEVADVVQRTYPDRIRIAVPLVTKSPSGDPLIDFGKLLKSDFADIGWMTRLGGMFGLGGGGGGINASLSEWEGKPKTFPHNVEIGVELAISRPSPPGSYDKKIVHYSFWELQQSDYKPRIADDRVGYFLTTNRDWSKPSDSRDIFNRYIDRWHLVKRDPSLAMCEPKKPITFYIEKTVPVRFRRAVRDGILEWNKAFEKVGFLNAVEVRQQTDDNEWKDLDPEDMNYSFFRWIVTGAGFAMGPHRANPFTGQIYDADIVFDDSMVRYFEQSAERLLASGATAMKANDPTLRDFFKQNPEWQRPVQAWQHFIFGEAEDAQLREAVRERMYRHGHHCCEYAEGMKHQMAVAHTMLAGAPKEVVEKFLYDVVKEVVTHEVGHTLGLRHNFKASSIYTLEEIKKRRVNGEATVGSVMDYNPVLFLGDKVPDEVPPGYFITPTIGPYDYWAIEYGYRPFDSNYKGAKKEGEKEDEGEEQKAEADKPETAAAPPADAMQAAMKVKLESLPQEVLDQLPPEVKKMIESGDIQKLMAQAAAAGVGGGTEPTTPGAPSEPSFAAPPSGEEAMLREIASRGSEPELAYATDQDCTFLAPDPRVNRFDMGACPLEWGRARVDLVNKRMDNILEWAVKDKESWYHLRQAFLILTFEKTLVLDYVGRYIGGQYFHRSHRGDADAATPFVHVDAQTQRQALGFIEEQLFSDTFFEVPPEVLNHLAPPRWWHEGMSIDFVMDFPVHKLIATLQWWNLFDRLYPNTLRRIHDAGLKTNDSDKFTVAEYIQRLQNACWSDSTNTKRLGQHTWTDNKPFVTDIRRSLQREYLGLVEPLVRRKPGEVLSPDLHAMMQYALKRLASQLDEVITAEKADFASQAHLVSCKSRIDRMLAPKLDEYQPALSFSLFGQETP